MSEFKPPPLLTLNKEQTLEALPLRWPDWWKSTYPGKFAVKSTWLCERLNAFEKDGFVYDRDAQLRIQKEEGVGPFDENGSVLSILIYNAQGYRRHDALVAAGWQSGSEELLAQAFKEERKIELLHDSLLGGSCAHLLTVKDVGGKLYAFLPRKRKYAVNIIGKPVRLEGDGKSGLPAGSLPSMVKFHTA